MNTNASRSPAGVTITPIAALPSVLVSRSTGGTTATRPPAVLAASAIARPSIAESIDASDASRRATMRNGHPAPRSSAAAAALSAITSPRSSVSTTAARHILLTVVLGAGLIGVASAPVARAAYTVTFSQVGSDVVASGSGSIDLTGLSLFHMLRTSSQDPHLRPLQTNTTR